MNLIVWKTYSSLKKKSEEFWLCVWFFSHAIHKLLWKEALLYHDSSHFWCNKPGNLLISSYSVSSSPVLCNIILIFLCSSRLFYLINEYFLSVILVIISSVNTNSLPPLNASIVCADGAPYECRLIFRLITPAQTYFSARHTDVNIFSDESNRCRRIYWYDCYIK